MRLTRQLLSNGRRPQLEAHVPYKEMMPPRLRPLVTGKGSKTNEVACLFEMSLLFACLKEADFNQETCNAEVAAFQTCYDNNLRSKRLRKEKLVKGELLPGQHKMEYQQVNMVLKRFPPIYKTPPK